MSWRNLQPSDCHSYHIKADGTPAYAQRFDEVLKFHAPGLAPVSLNNQAWHIGIDGTAAYPDRYIRTFGFYDGLAAAVTNSGWHHILPTGHAAYNERYQWCGNFQEGRCTVRHRDGQYSHINNKGKYLYPERWRYAGDYRDNIAVIQLANGTSTHIDLRGRFVHNKHFRDLDVFHKRLARARDSDGWMHIDINGDPVYTDRFAVVEPFYNGQARVERFNGTIAIIDEHGNTITETRAANRSEFSQLSADMVGFWRTHTIATAVELGVFDALPATSEQLSSTCNITADSARRLLFGLGSLKLVTGKEDYWQVTPKGEYLHRDHPMTLTDAALEYAGPLSEAWSRLPQALSKSSGWRAPDIFKTVAGDNTRCTSHHRMLRSYARHDYPAVIRQLDLQNGERIIDAGGGTGELSSQILSAYPSCHVTVLDLPEVVNGGRKHSPSASINWLAGNLFEPWSISADVVLLARILHDWDDDKALDILRQARQALTAKGRLHIIEMVIPDNSYAGALCDLHLLAVTGGRERSLAHYQSLLRKTGFKPEQPQRSNALQTIITGVPE